MEVVDTKKFDYINIYEVPLGKYKGQDVRDVYFDDPDYFQWMYDNCELSKDFVHILENLILTGSPF